MCPNCRAELEVASSSVDQLVKCSSCLQMVLPDTNLPEPQPEKQVKVLSAEDLDTRITLYEEKFKRHAEMLKYAISLSSVLLVATSAYRRQFQGGDSSIWDQNSAGLFFLSIIISFGFYLVCHHALDNISDLKMTQIMGDKYNSITAGKTLDKMPFYLIPFLSALSMLAIALGVLCFRL